METGEDRVDACLFFHSPRAEFAYWRKVWFGLAGIPEPRPEEMERMILRLVAAGMAVRKSYGMTGQRRRTV